MAVDNSYPPKFWPSRSLMCRELYLDIRKSWVASPSRSKSVRGRWLSLLSLLSLLTMSRKPRKERSIRMFLQSFIYLTQTPQHHCSAATNPHGARA